MAQFDYVISNGRIIDGCGREAFSGDVAVKDGLIVEVGAVSGSAKERIDADGRLVTPGYVDVHTHYDGQVTWDDTLDPSFSHGVTTIVTGNCGVGFAPVRPDGRRQLIELMESVEDIPGSALVEGMSWDWESFPDYLETLARRKWTMDVGAQISHAPLRAYVMGDRGARNEPATEEDAHRMAALVAEAMAAGAVGFSTSRILGHQTLEGQPIPGTFATEEELITIGRALGKTGSVFQVVPGGSTGTAGQNWVGEKPLAEEIAWMTRLSQEANVPVTFLIVEHGDDINAWREAFRLTDLANASGARLHPQTGARPAGMLTGFQGFHMFSRRPTYMKLADLPLAERIVELRKPEVRATILSEESLPAPTGSLKDNWHRIIESYLPRNVFTLGEGLDYEPDEDALVSTQAAAMGLSAQERLYDLMLEQDGRAMMLVPMMNYASGNQNAMFEMLRHPATIVGLADGGAHCGVMCDASATTYLLTHWARDRRRGPRLPLEHLIRKQTAETAALYGMNDRGMLRPGLRADLNVIDFDRLALQPPYTVADLPAGGRRILQKAKGYGVTMVRGVVTRRDDEDTGERPGRLIRGRKPQAMA